MYRCNRCHEYAYDGTVCHCKPFKIIADGEEYEQYANHHDQAARKFTKRYNEDNDYCLMDESMEIEVHDLVDAGHKTFVISAEQDIHYSCAEVKK